MDDTANRRYVRIVAAGGQHDVILARRAPAEAVVGGVEVAPARVGGQVGQQYRDPGVGCVATYQARLAGRWTGQQVTADITRRQADRAQAGDHDVGEVLAHPFALRQRFERRCCDLGAFALVGEVVMDAVHQIQRGREQAGTRRETGAGIGREFGLAGRVRRSKDEFRRGVVYPVGAVAKKFSHQFPRQLADRHARRLGRYYAGREHAQPRVCRLQ